MKRKDLETKTQMMYADEPKHVISTSHMEQKQNVVPSVFSSILNNNWSAIISFRQIFSSK